ncbi:DUF192 domain-containing protein [Alteromonas sp. CYL-A6]|uniref:DUF192 domain-containing protein n=1 Tax=Alteromonas nitratireducens TaxID=3390813 RepID=UPI0034C18CCB
MRVLSRAVLIGLLLLLTGFTEVPVAFDKAEIEINDTTYPVEFAYTFEQRARGLMFRESLCENCGMLFLFQPEKQASMWMKNTLIPLDVAFIDRNGVITDIKPLKPHDLTSVGASKVVTYALEMNQGWFAEHGVRAGDQIIIRH